MSYLKKSLWAAEPNMSHPTIREVDGAPNPFIVHTPDPHKTFDQVAVTCFRLGITTFSHTRVTDGWDVAFKSRSDAAKFFLHLG